MPGQHAVWRPNRVLGFVPNTRYPGYAVADGFGLAARGFGCWNLHVARRLERPCRALERRLSRTIRRHAPSLLVCSRPRSDDERRFVEVARRVAAGAGIEFVIREAAPARELLALPGETLPRALVRGFVPELKSRCHRALEPARYWRCAWDALGLVVGVLVERAPLSAAALARPEAFASAAFNRALTRSSATLTPTV